MKDTTLVERVPSGWPYVRSLTMREIEVMDYVIQGYTFKEIATALGIAKNTVDAHMAVIRVKLQVLGKGRPALIAAYLAIRQT